MPTHGVRGDTGLTRYGAMRSDDRLVKRKRKGVRNKRTKPTSSMDKLGYTFYPKDWWTSDTFFKLPPELRYLYLEIISLMYMNDGSWRANRIELTKRFGVDPMEKGWELLQSLFLVDGDLWTHPSVNKRMRRTIANRENGQLGGRPKTQITQIKNPNKPTLEIEEKENIKGKENELPIYVFPSFEDFWNKYNKKVGKIAAEKEWEKISQDDREKIMIHLNLYGLKEKGFKKDPERYLKKATWNDEVVIPTNGSVKHQTQQPQFYKPGQRLGENPSEQ